MWVANCSVEVAHLVAPSSRGETHRASPPPRRQNVSAELRPARALPTDGARALSGPLAMPPARGAAAAAALLAAALLLCAGAAAAARDHILRRDDLIGWGEVPAASGGNPNERRRGRAPGADAGAGGTDPDAQRRALPDPAAAAGAGAARPRGQEVLSWSPRVMLFRGLLTDAECDHLVARATPRLARSGVVDEEKDGEGVSDIRTSDGARSCSAILN